MWADLHRDILELFSALSEVRPIGYRDTGYSFSRRVTNDWTAREARLENPGADAFLGEAFTLSKREIGAEERAIAVAAIAAGANVKDVARNMMRRPARIAALLDRDARSVLDRAEIERAVVLARSGETLSGTARALGRSFGAVRRAVRGIVEAPKGTRRIDITGIEFGRLVPTHFIGGARSMWGCMCKCGAIDVRVESYKLRTGHTESCGCLQREIAARQIVERNTGAKA